MSTVLYRKYRSQNFAELVGQDHLVKALKSAIDHENLGHSLLFTGSRGTGKTSTARIVAKLINQLDDKENIEEYLDIVEIDAASNRGIEEIKDLKIKAYGLPAQLNKKVYIIDEVHMLSKDAFNALLKILEEPPDHVLFILATTEVDKIPETILSRVSRYDFKKISSSQIFSHLAKVVDSEKIQAENSALELIAKLASGSLRDALTMLEIFRNDQITSELIINSLGLIADKQYQELINCLENEDFISYQKKINQYVDRGINPIKFLLLFAEAIIVSKLFQNDPKQVINSLAEASEKIRHSPSPYLVLLNLGINIINNSNFSTNQPNSSKPISKNSPASPRSTSPKKPIITIDPADINLAELSSSFKFSTLAPESSEEKNKSTTLNAAPAPKVVEMLDAKKLPNSNPTDFQITVLVDNLKKNNILLASYVKQSYQRCEGQEIIFSHPSKLAKATISKSENQNLIKSSLINVGYSEYTFIWQDNQNHLQEDIGPISNNLISNNIAKLAEEIFNNPGGKYGESRQI